MTKDELLLLEKESLVDIVCKLKTVSNLEDNLLSRVCTLEMERFEADISIKEAIANRDSKGKGAPLGSVYFDNVRKIAHIDGAIKELKSIINMLK